MSLRSTALRLGISAAVGALCVTGAAVPASASTPAPASAPASAPLNDTERGTSAAPGNNNPPVYKGRVSARNGLLLRDSPTRGARIVRTEPYGAYVHIFCKTRGSSVEGNDRWYLLTDGTWAWGAAAYIDNIGPAPRWC
ncbi:SH3 domain-containing protein [Streptomyces indicus]|uniref:SH3 domain-containing protein n=1 Tax=Streptomyces indicus TaxID=417292 RepID=A0A1G8WJM3_9ACTN|nr:SH3 domain-containing protein [Streptomyces indicus]SDJ78326.1 SH3 domain-containing protein [Streptomyces indicus]